MSEKVASGPVLVALLRVPFVRELRWGKLVLTEAQNTAFIRIFNTMQNVFPRLQRSNVTISYQTNGTGLVGQRGMAPLIFAT